MILAGDIGGTKTILGLFDGLGERLELIRSVEYASADHPSAGAMVTQFLNQGKTAALRSACFAVAGPVIADRVKLTNLPWFVDAKALAGLLSTPRVALLNDVQATAIGALHLDPDELHALGGPAKPAQAGNIALIAAGTGLGEGFLFWDGARYHAGASEGGHADFAPRGPVQGELLAFLRNEFGEHVSYERVLSGPGLVNLYRFERMRSGAAEPDWLAARIAGGESAAAITEAALTGADPVCMATLESFAAIYGAEAGNLALKVLALGGVFVAGGIAPKILPELKKGGFMRSFTGKGRFTAVLSQIPVKVVLNTQVALLGAAHFARDL